MREINLFDPKLGIQSIIDSHESERLPVAKPMATAEMYNTPIDSAYNLANIRNLVENAICPQAGDGEILRPDIFSNSLKNCSTILAKSDNDQVHDFLRRDLYPLLENEDLLRTYCNLMLGG